MRARDVVARDRIGFAADPGAPFIVAHPFVRSYGYDTMRLSADPERFAVYREQELLHARFAMLGLVGVVIPEAFPSIGSTWFEVGAKIFEDDGLNYLGNSSAIHAQSILAVVFTQAFFMGLIESYRVNGGPAGDGLDPLHPGGPFFDPFGLADDLQAFAELKVKEIKNGRLPCSPCSAPTCRRCTRSRARSPTGRRTSPRPSRPTASPTAPPPTARLTPSTRLRLILRRVKRARRRGGSSRGKRLVSDRHLRAADLSDDDINYSLRPRAARGSERARAAWAPCPTPLFPAPFIHPPHPCAPSRSALPQL